MILPPATWPPVVWLWIAGAFSFAALLVKTWRRTVPGAAAFRGLVLANVIYISGSALEFVLTDPVLYEWNAGLMHVGIGAVGPCLVLLFADVTGLNRWLTPARRRWMLAAGLAIGALRLTDPWLGWMYHNYHDTQLLHGVVIHRFSPAPAFFVLQGLIVAGMLVGIALSIMVWREAGRLLRRHILLLAIACVVPVVVSLVYAFNITPYEGVDPTPAASLIALAITSWAMLRDRLVGVAPIARNFLVDHFGDAVLVTDRSRAVVDFNPAAQRFLGLSDRQSLGQPIRRVLTAWPDLSQLCAGDDHAAAEVLPTAGSDICWWANWYPLKNPGESSHQGFMLLLTDITERKRTERQLQTMLASRTTEWREATAAALRATEEEQTRLGHLLHDTLCQDLIGLRRTADAIADTLPTANSSQLRALGNELASANRRAREIAHLLEGPDLVHNSFEEALDATLRHLEKTYDLTCEVTIDPAFPTLEREQDRHLLRIIREAVSNGGRHGGARQVWVDMLVCPSYLRVSIANDGITPPPPEGRTEGLGTRQMRMRTVLLGGTISLRAGNGGGAVLELVFPLPSTTPT
jgi:PAS domain S-box-containing protein